jgi:FMN phosphatase YigB (HAD superfamily)
VPVERRAVTPGGASPGPVSLDAARIRAVTFDFGDTLVVVPAAAFRSIVAVTAADVSDRLGLDGADRFLDDWEEERIRQWEEDVAVGREMDLARRFARVVARRRGLAPPAAGRRWDDDAVDLVADPGEVAWAVERYRDRWIAGIPVPPEVGPVLARLAVDRQLAILSNWPHAPTIDTYVDRAGWRPYLAAVVVSSRVGAIKPDAAIFRAAAAALGLDGAPPGSILHVGDDRRADVAGARRAGWRAAWLRRRNPGSPLPGAGLEPGPDDPPADIEIDDLADLLPLLETRPG